MAYKLELLEFTLQCWVGKEEKILQAEKSYKEVEQRSRGIKKNSLYQKPLNSVFYFFGILYFK